MYSGISSGFVVGSSFSLACRVRFVSLDPLVGSSCGVISLGYLVGSSRWVVSLGSFFGLSRWLILWNGLNRSVSLQRLVGSSHRVLCSTASLHHPSFN